MASARSGADEHFASARDRVAGTVLAAALFDPNVPDPLGGDLGVVTGPWRWLRRTEAGAVNTLALVIVTSEVIVAVRARMRARGLALGEDLARWERSSVDVIAVPAATWTGRRVALPAFRVTQDGYLVAELRARVDGPSARAVVAELVRP